MAIVTSENWAQAVERSLSLAAGKASSEDEGARKLAFLRIHDEYVPIIDLLNKFSIIDNGIQFTRKLSEFEEVVANLCPDEVRLEEAFSSLRAAALRSAATARRLTAVGVSFSRRQHQQRLRTAFFSTVLQDTFNKLELLQRGDDPMYLINAANLMGDYFAEARLSNGSKMAMLAAPLLGWLRALLAVSDPRAHRALATQLLKNGRDLSAMMPQELEELSTAIRLQLLRPPCIEVAWLLLSADLCMINFGPLPIHLQQFYGSQLNIKWETFFREETASSSNPMEEPMPVAPEGRFIPDNVGQSYQARPPTRTTTLQARLDLNTWRENLNSEGSSAEAAAISPPTLNEPMSTREDRDVISRLRNGNNRVPNTQTRPPIRCTVLAARLDTWRENLNPEGSSSEAAEPWANPPLTLRESMSTNRDYNSRNGNNGPNSQIRPPIRRCTALSARLDLNTWRENLQREEA